MTIMLSLIFNDESVLSVPRIKVGMILGLDRDVYCDVKKLLIKFSFLMEV